MTTAAGQRPAAVLAPGGVLRLVGGTVLDGPDAELGDGPRLLERAARTGCGPLLRMYRPVPTLAFTGRDRVTPGYAAATAAAREHGFAPAVRAPGGRAVALHADTLCVEIAVASADPRTDLTARFAALGALVAGALRDLGVPALVGRVPGEYCPGEHSVAVAARHKVVGTAQRLNRHGWLLGANILVRRPDPVRAVTVAVYDALHLPLAPESVAAAEQWAPGIDTDDVADSVLRALRRRGLAVVADVDPPAPALPGPDVRAGRPASSGGTRCPQLAV